MAHYTYIATNSAIISQQADDKKAESGENKDDTADDEATVTKLPPLSWTAV